MDFAMIVELIGTIGFPLVAVLVMGWFIFKIYNDTQAKGKEREERLYEEIKANREVNAQAIATITLYADRLDTIQHDVSEIKSNITTLTERVNH